MLHVLVNPFLLDILLLEEAGDLARAGPLGRLLIVGWKVSLPVSIDQVVAHGLEGFYFALGPLVQVN